MDGIGRAAIKLLNESMLREEGNLEESYADFLMEVRHDDRIISMV